MRLTLLSAAGALFAAAVVVPAGAAAAAPLPDAGRRGTLQLDADALRDVGVTGVQARVVDDKGREQVVTSGVADVRTGRPVPANGHFRTASVTKAFVATTVLQLVGEGRLSLDDPVERLLPGVVAGNGNDGRKITVRHLLQHTSGLHDDLPGFSSPEDFYQHRYDTYPVEELVARTMRHRPDFAPGKGWAYSNTGYLLLGMIVERITGRPWHTEVGARVLRPLRLGQTSWPGLSPRLPRPYAKGYQRFETGPLIDVTENRDASYAGAAGGLITTTRDLNRFLRALAAGRLLRPAQMRELRRTVPVPGVRGQVWPGARDGLGLFSRPLSCGGLYWFHTGDILGYKTRNGVTADGRRSVVVSMSTVLEDSAEHMIQQENAASALVDHALCGAG
ncbi:serine hydrolase domain-containing protein [Actinomadura roseirufa]|uniref:serine hydrolase domain-containing protein n=1 Tax=Actinomadura roseirufa TaxID=2094049 RepID=UPI001A955952|nr:serine hydrolase domain-containing protein [Actinomadura roseirufa]